MAPNFCAHCGARLAGTERFCTNCGQAVQGPAAAPQPQAPRPAQPAPPPPPAPDPVDQGMAAYTQSGGEQILSVLPGLIQQTGFLGMKQQVYNLVITPQRLIFAFVSSQMQKDAVTEARTQAKSEGKGFFGTMGAQMRWMDQIVNIYFQMPVDAILTRYPGSFQISPAAVRRVRFRMHRDDESSRSTETMHIDTTGAKYKFKLQMTTIRTAQDQLRQVLGNVVK
jgi:hypothetical protein